MFNDLLKDKAPKKKRVEWVKVLDYQRTKKKVQRLQLQQIQLVDKLMNIATVVNDNRGKIREKKDMDALMELILDLINEDTK